MTRVVLASSSQRRKDLLSYLIEDFEIVVPNCEEIDMDSPEETAFNNAILKARCVKRHNQNAIVIASDTVVARDNKIFGKPPTREKAITMLMELQGKWHQVFSGVCVIGTKEYSYTEESQVQIKEMTREQIALYVDNYAPYDKAGGYGIQDDEIVQNYKGDYHNIMGLPLKKLEEILRENDCLCQAKRFL